MGNPVAWLADAELRQSSDSWLLSLRQFDMRIEQMGRVRVTWLIVAIMLAVAACSGPSGAATSDSSVVRPEGLTKTATGREVPAETLSMSSLELPEGTGNPLPQPKLGPLDIFYTRIGAASAGMSEREAMLWMAEHALARRVYVANCLHEQGFEYIPGLWGHGFAYHDYSLLSAPYGSREFVGIYGFGISNDFRFRMTRHWSPQPGLNPNEAILDAMSDGERAAYIEARWGPDERSWGGCEGMALDRHFLGVAPEQFASLNEELQTWHIAIDADEELAELNRRYVACMADAGESGFTDRWALTGMLSEHWAPDGELAVRTSEERAAFREWEIAVAIADWDCRDELNYDDTRRAINIRHQYAFVDRHWAELEAWALYVESQRG
ncbi:MAG: hypothetical protein FWG25_02790 [Promicromonosporaceae bacterium]|nr:hypothetical protein [Promicromonosporaceae bacterium]